MRERLIDALHSRSASAAAKGAMTVLNVLQDIEHPADQVLGLACAFKNVADVCGLTVAELFQQIDDMEADCRFRQVPTLAAVRRYAAGEIRSKYL